MGEAERALERKRVRCRRRILRPVNTIFVNIIILDAGFKCEDEEDARERVGC